MNPEDKRQWLAFISHMQYELGVLIREAGPGRIRNEAKELKTTLADEERMLLEP